MNALAACVNAVIIVAAFFSMAGSVAIFHIWRTQRRMALVAKSVKSEKILR